MWSNESIRLSTLDIIPSSYPKGIFWQKHPEQWMLVALCPFGTKDCQSSGLVQSFVKISFYSLFSRKCCESFMPLFPAQWYLPCYNWHQLFYNDIICNIFSCLPCLALPLFVWLNLTYSNCFWLIQLLSPLVGLTERTGVSLGKELKGKV